MLMNVLTEIAVKGYVSEYLRGIQEFLKKVKEITRRTGWACLALLLKVFECDYRSLCNCIYNKTQEDIWRNPAGEKTNPVSQTG